MKSIISPYISLSIALFILSLWGSTFYYSMFIFRFTVDDDKALVKTLLLTMMMEFLYTSIFITAHDSLHGIVFNKNEKINNLIGGLCLFLYAGFEYKDFKQKHMLHHTYAATEKDPDYSMNNNIFKWFTKFMLEYMNLNQFLHLTSRILIFYLLNIPLINITLFVGVAPITAAIRLFYFGTYLPHRREKDNKITRSSNNYRIISFFTCLHFDYHEEHHENPKHPWFLLPSLKFEKVD